MSGTSRYDRYRREATSGEAEEARRLYAAAELVDRNTEIQLSPAGSMGLLRLLYAASRELANGRPIARDLRSAIRELAAAIRTDDS